MEGLETTILLVDDHEALRRALREWIETLFPACRIIEAASGEEALAVVERTSPHLVTMDIGLPGMNGIEVTRRLKAIAPAVPVLMFSVHDEEEYRRQAFEVGASAYVSKKTMSTEMLPNLSRLMYGADEMCSG